MKEYKEVELRSEELQEIMGKIPSWILRQGITLLFAIIVVVLVGSYFFRYPDVVVANMTLTGRYPASQVMARASGKISKLYVADGQDVTAGAMLAVIENTASTDDVAFLKRILTSNAYPDSLIKALRYNDTVSLSDELSLGDVQTAYTTFLNSLNDYDNYYSLDYYAKKIENLRQQLNKYRAYYANQRRRQQVVEEQHRLAVRQHVRDSTLFVGGVTSPSEYDNAKAAFLQSRYTLENGYASLENLIIQIGEMESNLLDIELQQAEKERTVQHACQMASEQLLNAINSWELTYCLTAPTDGRVTFTRFWHENQFIQAGDRAFTVVPDDSDELIGKALLPVERSGKVKVGQRAIIRFVNFPDQEFGVVNGRVGAISLVPEENFYQIEITLPDGLTTNYGQTLPVSHEMKAAAEIITQNVSLLERLLMPLRKIFKEGYNSVPEI